MKKLIFGLLGILSASTLLMVGCNDDGGADSSSSSVENSSVEQVAVTVDITDSALTMDCFETVALELETKNAGAIVWESSDPSILAVDENGVLTANVKEGTVTITAKSGSVSDTCEVTVLRKNAIPSFAVMTELDLMKGTSYTISGLLTYNGIDVSSYATYTVNEAGGDASAVSVASEGNDWTFTANETGATQFTVSATIFGQTYTDTVSITVNEADIIYLVTGATLNGDVNELLIRKGLTEYAPMYTSNVEIYDKGVRVEDSALTWTVSDPSIAEIGQDGKLIGKKEGIATLSTTYKEMPIDVQIHVLKDRQYITADGVQDVDLDVSVNVNTNAKTRTYSVNAMQFVNLTLGETGVNYGSLISATIDGEALPADMFEFANGVIRTTAMTFGTETYGEKTLVFESEVDDIVYNFTVKALFITKTISTVQEYRDNVPTKWVGDKNFGYYVLDADLEFAGYGIGAYYATDWNYSNGFRGTLDGRNHAIKNCKADNYGLCSQVGNGAVIKNLVFDDLLYVGSGKDTHSRSILARGIGGATIENITINLTEDSTPENGSIVQGDTGRGGLLSHTTKNNVYKNITVNGKNHQIACLIGVSEGLSTYQNVVVNDAVLLNSATNYAGLYEGISMRGKVLQVTGLTENGDHYEYLIGKPFAPSENILLYLDGEKVDLKLLQWTIEDEGVAKFEEGVMVAVSEGSTMATASYEGIEIKILVTAQVYERVEIKSDAPATDVNLDLSATYDTAENKTVFSVNETATASVTFEEESGKDYGEIMTAMLDGSLLDESTFAYANGTFTFNTSAFGTNNYGEKTLVIEMLKGETVYKFETKVLLITKVLSSKIELEESLVVKKVGHMVYGYYVLDQDVDFEGQAMNTTPWVNDWAHKQGFVATFDGRGHKLLNYKASENGFIAQVSEGAVIKNITFDGVLRTSHKDAVIAKGMGYATVENVTINFADSADLTAWVASDTYSAGLIALGTNTCKYVNLTINAPGKTIYKVFTRENDTKATYENVVINAGAVNFYYGEVSIAPTGVTLNTGDAEA